MIAVDASILVYAHRADSVWNEAAVACLDGLAQRGLSWGIPWPCVYEFFSIVTHPRIFQPPSTARQAIEQLEAWFEAPDLSLLSEEAAHWAVLKAQLERGKVGSLQLPEARIAALCVAHGVTELWTVDGDFTRFPALTSRNPLLDQE